MRMSLRSLALAACGVALAACGGDLEPPPEAPPQEQEDPCAPHGHIHREPAGDWCHCDRGYQAAAEGMACLVDPNYTPRDEFDFGDEGVHACWHVDNGPYGSVMAAEDRQPRVDAFHTLYTVTLRPAEGQYTGTFQFKAFGTGDFIVYLSQQVPLIVHEGERTVPIAAEKPTSACAGLQDMVGMELTNKVTYTFTLGPTSLQQLRMVTEYLP